MTSSLEWWAPAYSWTETGQGTGLGTGSGTGTGKGPEPGTGPGTGTGPGQGTVAGPGTGTGAAMDDEFTGVVGPVVAMDGDGSWYGSGYGVGHGDGSGDGDSPRRTQDVHTKRNSEFPTVKTAPVRLHKTEPWVTFCA